MGVGPHDDLSRGGQPLLGDQGVLYAHLAHVVEMGDAVLMGKLPCLLAQLGRLDILAGGIVVQHNGDPVLVKDLGEASLLKLRDGHRGGDIVARTRFSLASISWPGWTEDSPAAFARIFCVIVIPMECASSLLWVIFSCPV